MHTFKHLSEQKLDEILIEFEYLFEAYSYVDEIRPKEQVMPIAMGSIMVMEDKLGDVQRTDGLLESSKMTCGTNYKPLLEGNEELEGLEWSKERKFKPSTKELPEFELKKLSNHLQYTIFLKEGSKLPVNIELNLEVEQKKKFLEVFKKHKRVTDRKISDIKGISPYFHTHKILMEEDFRPTVQPQRRLNPNMK